MPVSNTLLRNYPYLVLVHDNETGEETYKHAESVMDIFERFGSSRIFNVLAIFKLIEGA